MLLVCVHRQQEVPVVLRRKYTSESTTNEGPTNGRLERKKRVAETMRNSARKRTGRKRKKRERERERR